jgi:hypothetical protein
MRAELERNAMRSIAVTVAFMLVLAACGGSDSTAPPSNTERATSRAISGDPAPSKLQGTWRLVSVAKNAIKQELELVISAGSYKVEAEGGIIRGEVVTKADEIDFFNEDLCGLALSAGLARYRWKVDGHLLRLRLMGKEP